MSKQKFKVLSKAGLAAVLASTTLVPAAVVSADEAVASKIETLVFQDGEKLVTLSLDSYVELVLSGDLNQEIKYVVGDNNEFYLLDDYVSLSISNDMDSDQTFKELKEKAVNDLEVTEGKVENGKVIPKDEQPEDRLNETLVYNFAA